MVCGKLAEDNIICHRCEFSASCQMDSAAVSFTIVWPFLPNCKIMNIKADHILHLNYHFCIIFSSYEWFLNYNLFFWKANVYGNDIKGQEL